MTEYQDEHQRAEQGTLGRDYICMAPESVALRALIDAIGSVVVLPVDNSNRGNCGKRKLVIDENEAISLTDEAKDSHNH